MAPRKLVSEIPPPADSSSDDTESEEEEESDGPVDDQHGDAEKQEETDDDDDGDGDEENENKSHLVPVTSPVSDPDLHSPSAYKIKPQKPSLNPNKIAPKRSRESEEESIKKKKKKSKAAGDDAEEPKKGSAIQRLWSEGDELAILEGLIKYKSEKGADPSADMLAFHEFIKKSLHVDVSKSQLSDKIRRLKQKFRKGENGQFPVFSKPHDLKCFELSKKVWDGKTEPKPNGKVQNGGGGGGGGGSVTLGLPSSGTSRKQASANQQVKNVEKAGTGMEVKNVEKAERKEKTKSRVKSKEEIKAVEKKHQAEGDDNVENVWEKYPLLGESLNSVALSEGLKAVLREKLGMLQKSKLEELEQKWKCLKQAELGVFVQRIELVNEQVKLGLDLIMSS